jgi:ATP-dependent RNA helicase RhlE
LNPVPAGVLFSDLQLHATLLANVARQGYTAPTPIQAEAIPHVLTGKDVVALAQTGTGKTAAFALPILHRMQAGPHVRGIKVLVLAPTRELASQIGEGFKEYGEGFGFKHAVIFGGVGKQPQVDALRRGIDILVATPGRLLDLMNDRLLDYRQLQVLVLDEADRMLDMGFIHDVKKIVAALPSQRQTLLFSATMPRDIEELAQRILNNPARVAVTPPSTTVDAIGQSIFMVESGNKRALLHHLLGDAAVKRALVFTRTKHGANRVAEFLDAKGIGAAAIHGNKSQSARERALDGFRVGTVRVLVATDIAARGIDIDGITHVIQIDLTDVPEQYVHRIGRTARAGATGIARPTP